MQGDEEFSEDATPVFSSPFGPAGAWRRRVRVAVVETDPALSSKLCFALAEDGHEVFPFADGKELLHHMHGASSVRDQPHLVVIGAGLAEDRGALAVTLRAIDQDLRLIRIVKKGARSDDGSLADDELSLRCAPDPDVIRLAARLLVGSSMSCGPASA